MLCTQAPHSQVPFVARSYLLARCRSLGRLLVGACLELGRFSNGHLGRNMVVGGMLFREGGALAQVVFQCCEKPAPACKLSDRADLTCRPCACPCRCVCVCVRAVACSSFPLRARLRNTSPEAFTVSAWIHVFPSTVGFFQMSTRASGG